jgi:tRNA threonylcarbamoyladenosine modification (KEOPS) complex  Pcc1 subunit
MRVRRRFRMALLAALAACFGAGCLEDHPVVQPGKVVDARAVLAQDPSLSGFDTVEITVVDRGDPARVLKLWKVPGDSSGSSSIYVGSEGENVRVLVRGFKKGLGFCLTETLEDGTRIERMDSCGAGLKGPKVFAGDDTAVAAGDLVRLHGVAEDSLGPIVKMEWSIGGNAYVTAPAGDTAFTAPAGPATIFCVFRATGSAGRTGADTLKVSVSPSASADLREIRLSQGNLAPPFAPSVTAYRATVPDNYGSFKITPVAVDSGAEIFVDGVKVPSGQSSGALALKPGANPIVIKVSARTGKAVKSDTLIVDRNSTNSVALLELKLVLAGRSDTVISGDSGWSDTLPNNMAEFRVIPFPADTGASLKLVTTAAPAGTELLPGKESTAFQLLEAENRITLNVTAHDGSSTHGYRFTIFRMIAVTSLSNLEVSAGRLSPPFSPEITDYLDTVPSTTAALTLKPTAADTAFAIKVDPGSHSVASGAVSPALPLAFGSDTLSVTVTGRDGKTKRTYTVVVMRPRSRNAALAALTVSAGSLSPAFSPGTADYADSLSSSQGSFTVTPVPADPGATVKVNGIKAVSGVASQPIILSGTSFKIPVEVTAQDSFTTQTYWITAVRPLSSDADLAGLTISAGVLNPPFQPGTRSYRDSVPTSQGNITVTPSAASGATIRVNGTIVGSGGTSQPITLPPGTDTVRVLVTAQDGVTAKEYDILVTRRATPFVMGYMLNSDASGATQPKTKFAFNSSGGAVTLGTGGVGIYEVTFAGLGAGIGADDLGIAHATAYDTLGTQCKAGLPTLSGSDMRVHVSCWGTSGSARYSRFTLALFQPRDPLSGSNGYAFGPYGNVSSYAPDSHYYNSSGQPIQIRRSGTGVYSVGLLAFLSATNGGSTLVSALADNAGRCNSGGWLTSGGGDWTSNVDCYDAAGHPADDTYTMVATGPITSNADMGLAYALVDDTVADSTILTGTRWSNSSGGGILVNHKSAGSYWVTFKGFADVQPLRTGNIQITPYIGTGSCTVEAWGGAPDVTAYVACFTRTGAPADGSFTIWALK